MYAKMSSAMGFTWVFGFAAAFTGESVVWWGYIILNGLQGTFIAFSFILNARLYRLLKLKISEKSSTHLDTNGRSFPKFSSCTLNQYEVSTGHELSNLDTICRHSPRWSSSSLNQCELSTGYEKKVNVRIPFVLVTQRGRHTPHCDLGTRQQNSMP